MIFGVTFHRKSISQYLYILETKLAAKNGLKIKGLDI